MSSTDGQVHVPGFAPLMPLTQASDTTVSSMISRLPPALAALLAHLPGIALAAALMLAGAEIPPLLLLLGVAFAAAALAWLWRLPIWWRYINLLFLPLVGLTLHLQTQSAGLDPNWFLAAFLLLALTSFGAVRSRVPLYLSSPRAAAELARRLPPNGRLIDLGCGLGGPLARIHGQRPDAHLAGVETAPLNWLLAKLRLLGRADIRLGSLWNANLGAHDIVYAYLSPAPMPALWDKARAEMKPGSLLISNTFAVPDRIADETLELGDLSHARLLIWRM
jgi:hypothetical protein